MFVFHGAQQIGFEKVITDIDMKGQPVRCNEAVTYPCIDGESIVTTEFCTTGAGDYVETAFKSPSASYKCLTREEVPAQRNVLILHVAIFVGQKRRAATEQFKTGLAQSGFSVNGFDKKVLGDMVSSPDTCHRI